MVFPGNITAAISYNKCNSKILYRTTVYGRKIKNMYIGSLGAPINI